MKKTSYKLLLPVIAMLICVAGLVSFAMGGEKPARAEITTDDLSGRWLMAVKADGGAISYPGEKVAFTRDSFEGYDITSGYEIKNGKLILKDADVQYNIKKQTPEYIRLYVSDNTYIDLIRSADSDVQIKPDILDGMWTVVYRNTGNTTFKEQLEFTADTIYDYRNDETRPFTSFAYHWEKNTLYTDVWGLVLDFVPLDENMVFLIEQGTGYVWQLEKSGEQL